MTTSLNLFLSAKEYYLELYKNFQLANHSIFILGWDIHTNVDLVPHDHNGVAPTKLYPLLKYVANKNKNLNIYLLPWEYAFFYTFERDLLLDAKMKWTTPSNIHFFTDGTNPIGASHHQKIVLIDDTLAYCGGIDLTVHRWDDQGHRPVNPYRKLPDNSPYPPYHDLQLRVKGELVTKFSQIVRKRYKNAVGINIDINENKNNDLILVKGSFPLPTTKATVLQTRPQGTFGKELREIETGYLKLINKAKNLLYIENQYLTSNIITLALKEKLKNVDCPEILIVLPKVAGDWLELETMGRLQAEKCRELIEVDRHNKLQILYPDNTKLKEKDYIVVHSKLMLADNNKLIVGSANLTNRSLGLDTECSVLTQGNLGDLFYNLLSMFYDLTPKQIETEYENQKNLKLFIQSLNSKSIHRRLKAINIDVNRFKIPVELIPDLEYLDQSKPVKFDKELNLYNKAIKKRWKILQKITQNWGFSVTIIIAITIAFIWYYIPIETLLDKESELYYKDFLNNPFTILILWTIYFIAGLLFVPINILILLTSLLFTPVKAFLYIVSATQFFCVATYLIGFILKKIKNKPNKNNTNKLVNALQKNSLLTFIIIRVLPIAPSTVIGMVAGYIRTSLLKFQFGSGIGLLPVTLALIFILQSLIAIIENTNWQNVTAFLSIILFLSGTYKLAKTRFAGYL